MHLANRFFGVRRNHIPIIIGLALLGIGLAFVVYVSGGTKYVYVQLMYLPIILTGLAYSWRGGLIAGVIAGVLMGPFMPLEVAIALPQPTEAWLIRLVFFSINGVISGTVAGLMRYRIRILEKLNDEVALTYGRTLRALVVLIGERDDETADHSERVAYNAVKIGEALELSPVRLEVLYWAALLHDLGKIGIKEAILNKPGALTSEERLEMQRHVEIGYRVIVNASEDFAPIAEVVAAHHERFDGNGYPNRLVADAIPIEARIVSVVDVFEALVSRRPYHEAISVQDALTMIRNERDKQFDARVVDRFTSLLGQGELLTHEDAHLLQRIRERYHGGGLFVEKFRSAQSQDLA